MPKHGGGEDVYSSTTVQQTGVNITTRPPTMKRVVDQLVSASLSVKEPVLGDARRTLIRATPDGAKWINEGRKKRVISGLAPRVAVRR